ncbi:MAG: oligosaccharide flippase family protein [Candidatus Omnitrophica bacterium]|nr:oligosaccharide flippase family protein [Candidatus Omnitrophota bacterium]
MALTLGQRLFAHGGIYVASRLANRGIALFLLVPVYTRFLGADGYGAIRVLNYLGLFFFFFFSQGLIVAWYRLRFDQQTEDELKIFESTLIWYLSFSCVAGLLIVSVCGDWIATTMTSGIPYFPLGFLTVVGACFNVFANLYERKLQADQKPVAFGIFSGLRTILNLILVVLFVATLRLDVLGKVSADTLSALILAILAIAYMRPRGLGGFSRAKLTLSLSYGLPLLPHSLAVTFNEMVGTLFVNNQLGVEEAGIYSLGLQLATLSLVLALALNQAYSPIFLRTVKDSEMAKEEGDEKRSATLLAQVSRSGLLLITFVGCLAMSIAAFGREVIMLLATPEFGESWIVVAPISGSVLTFTLYAVFNQVVYYVPARAKWIGVMTVLGAISNFGLCFLLIPHIRFLGPAIALLTSNAILAFGTFLLSRDCLPIRYPFSTWGLNLLLIYGALLAFWTIDWFGEVGSVRFLMKLMILSSFVPASCVLSGLAPRHLFRFLSEVRTRFFR